MANKHLLAAGHNQTTLTPLHELAPPLFDRYRIDLKTFWHGEVARITGGDLRIIRDGLPWVELLFHVMSVPEAQLLRATFFAAGELTAPVTLQTLNMDTNMFQRFNGTMRWPDLTEMDRGMFVDVRVVIEHLEYIGDMPSAADSGFNAGFNAGFGG